MVRRLLRRTIESFERKWNYDASYLKEIVDLSPLAALKFSLATSLGSYRRDVPRDALFAAGITAVRSEDCGPCTQLAITMAEQLGVRSEILRAILKDDVAAMPEEVALAWRFTRATLVHDAAADEYRDEIVRRWGPRAVVTLAFAITTARMYPTVKYAMGHGKICSRVIVNGAPVAIDRGLTSSQWRLTPDESHTSRAS
jgi:alkylhydroperoxidase family enzyme